VAEAADVAAPQEQLNINLFGAEEATATLVEDNPAVQEEESIDEVG
jgi:hypothetical protein